MDNLDLIRLRSISNEIELAMIKDVLDDNNVLYIIKDQGAGGYMRIIGGGSIFGTDVMVAEADYEQAITLLESIGIV
ncbi:MAG TPA: DUF2007 domain-containing protein [Tissierellaceae bacterium]|nr:DUF2007 domain-containing protein [Tissierellaceae bacterium]